MKIWCCPGRNWCAFEGFPRPWSKSSPCHDAMMPFTANRLAFVNRAATGGPFFYRFFSGSPKEVRCIHFCHRYSAVEWDERGVFEPADLLGMINTFFFQVREILTIFIFKRLAHIVASTYYLLWDEVACKVFVKKWSVLDLPMKSP